MQAKVNRTLVIICIGVVFFGASLPSMAQTLSPALLPPFPTPPPAPTPTPLPPPQPQLVRGATIELLAHAAFEVWQTYFWQDLWTGVQWQDLQGLWHDVAGWQGTLDAMADGVGRKTWWVAAADLDKGPFRWVVHQNQGGSTLFTSESFSLPAAPGNRVMVEAVLGP